MCTCFLLLARCAIPAFGTAGAAGGRAAAPEGACAAPPAAARLAFPERTTRSGAAFVRDSEKTRVCVSGEPGSQAAAGLW